MNRPRKVRPNGHRSRSGWAALGLLLSLLLPGCGADPTSSAPAPRTAAVRPATKEAAFQVAVLGDSITAGLGLPLDQAFPAVAEATLKAEGLDIRIQNNGLSGDTSTGGAQRVDWVLKQDPDVLVVELGGNDLLRGQPVALTEEKLRAIVQAGKASGAQVLLLGISAPGAVGPDHKAAFDAIYPRVAESEGVLLLPGFLDGLMGKPELLQADGLHPTAEGHRQLAERLVPALRPLIPPTP